MSSYPPPGPPAPGPVPPDPYSGVADPLVTRSLSEWAGGVAGVVTRSWQQLVLIQLAAGLATTLGSPPAARCR